jgi:uncharacterized alkaline shock family protein YloU
MAPLLDTFMFSIIQIQDSAVQTIVFLKLLEFYGVIGDTDILHNRQKIVIQGKSIIKRPFLKQKEKECIKSLLEKYKKIEGEI